MEALVVQDRLVAPRNDVLPIAYRLAVHESRPSVAVGYRDHGRVETFVAGEGTVKSRNTDPVP